MDKNLYGYLLDLDRILWSEISLEDQRRELDHFLYSVEGIIRNERLLTLDETRRIFYAAQTMIDSGFWRHLTRAIIIEGLAIRRMTKNPLVRGGQFRSFSSMLHDSVRYMDDLPLDKWSMKALIEAGKAYERMAAHTDKKLNLKRAGKVYSRALRITGPRVDQETLDKLEDRVIVIKTKLSRISSHEENKPRRHV